MCSAVCSLYRNLCENEFVLRHIGHLVISSGHSYGAIDAGASQYFGSNPHTEPDIRPPGPDSPGDHFFHVEIDFYSITNIRIVSNLYINSSKEKKMDIQSNFLPLAIVHEPNNPPESFAHSPNRHFVYNMPFHVLVA